MIRMLSPSSRFLAVYATMSTRPGRRAAQSQESRLFFGVTQIRAVEGIRIAEHGRRFFEQDPVFGPVDRGLPPVPFEHGSVYTKLGGQPGILPLDNREPDDDAERDERRPKLKCRPSTS
jgi:hypothetical protein